MTNTPRIIVTPLRAMLDIPLAVHLENFPSEQPITIRAQIIDGKGIVWKSQAVYESASDGRVNLNMQAPIVGSYKDANPMGLIWSMTPQIDNYRYDRNLFLAGLTAFTLTFAAIVNDEVVASVDVERLIFADDVRRIAITADGLDGVLFLPPDDKPHPAIITLKGSSGGLSQGVASMYAAQGYAALALAYFNRGHLPNTLVDIPIEYFEKAIHYLEARHDIDNERLAVVGKSRGGELALLLGSIFPQLKVILADVPSGVLWNGFGYDWEQEGPRPAWVYNGKALPYMDTEYDAERYAYRQDYIERGEGIPTAPGFRAQMRQYPNKLKQAEIPVERINGAVLMLSGDDDQMWPSVELTEIAMRRFKLHNFQKPYQHICYAGAGHVFDGAYLPTTMLNTVHRVNNSFYALGGTPEANYRAGVDSWQKKLEFLAMHL